MDEKRRMDSQSEVARNREGRLAVRVRLLRLQSDPASEDHGAGGSMRLNGPPDRPDPRSGRPQPDDLHDLSGWRSDQEDASNRCGSRFFSKLLERDVWLVPTLKQLARLQTRF